MDLGSAGKADLLQLSSGSGFGDDLDHRPVDRLDVVLPCGTDSGLHSHVGLSEASEVVAQTGSDGGVMQQEEETSRPDAGPVGGHAAFSR